MKKKDKKWMWIIIIIVLIILVLGVVLTKNPFRNAVGNAILSSSPQWVKVGPPHVSKSSCNVECAKQGGTCSDTGCSQFLSTYEKKYYTGGERLVVGSASIHYGCSNTWGSLSSSYVNYCCCSSGTVSCNTTFCSQTDGGNNVYLKGTDTYYDLRNGTCQTITNTDYCINVTALWEYNCRSSGLRNCPSGYGCSNGACVTSCTPNCVGKTCGDNGCGGSCGTCGSGQTCTNGSCVASLGFVSIVSTPSLAYVSIDNIPTAQTPYNVNLSVGNHYISFFKTGYNNLSGNFYVYPGSNPLNILNVTLVPSGDICADSDGGQYEYVKGTVSKGNTSFIDTCISSTNLREYYCYNNEIIHIIFGCGYYGCNNGACNQVNCLDSDGGQDYYTYGACSKGNTSLQDYCINGTYLREYYCTGSFCSWNDVNAPTGYICSGGKFVSTSVCADSDGGINLNQLGIAQKNNIGKQDYCTTSYYLREYYCNNVTDSVVFVTSRCSYGCYKGVCNPYR